jgi:hypothetical protein
VSSCDPWELHPQATFRAMAAYAVPGAEYKLLRAGTSERMVKYRVQGLSSPSLDDRFGPQLVELGAPKQS